MWGWGWDVCRDVRGWSWEGLWGRGLSPERCTYIMILGFEQA